MLFLLLVVVRLHAIPTQVSIAKLSGKITVDGDVTDSAWKDARKVEGFVEYFRGDNTIPPARTVGLIAYDAEAVYVAFEAEDPRPRDIRAPLVDRDKVLGDQDYVAILIDTLNDRRSGVAFRVNPRGVQTDSVVNDANGEEDFSPDFFYEAVARRTPKGWAAEMRIPLSSLRYPASADPQSWGVILMRNYPRDFRYIMSNTPIPKNSNCFLCHAATLSGLEDLPTGSHFTLTPYTAAQFTRPSTAGAEQKFTNDLGFDLKWNPSTRLTVDATLNPDFSQIEADVPQLSVNNRFALSYPEKRTFFLESVDLLSTPMRAVYTRTIHSPAWGLRATGQSGASAYTLLVGEDRGGGVTIVPGPYGSQVLPQDEASKVLIGRWRRSFGDSFAGVLASAREMEGGGHNRVIGPDFSWKPTEKDRIAGQALLSDTNGATGYGSRVYYTRDEKRYDVYAAARVLSPEFRADNGFIPQVGIQETYVEGAGHLYPKRGLTYVRAYAGVAYNRESESHDTIWRQFHPGVYFQGKWGSDGWITYRAADRERVQGKVLDYSFVEFSVRAAPLRWLPAVKLEGSFGEKVDYTTGRLGDGANLALSSSVRPTDHLELQLTTSREWLDLPTGRLFSAQVDWLKATYTFSARSLVRVTAQRDAFEREGAARKASTALSALYGYKLNWQTVFFVGFGEESAFMKVAYAFQR
ncbi:MAG TPA: DUF5916 domain-containing protein [Thermoanaerobaculia bacterium]|nr:DUF5916 domain-containing protein [Thermoanaerobaculia bacterium]